MSIKPLIIHKLSKLEKIIEQKKENPVIFKPDLSLSIIEKEIRWDDLDIYTPIEFEGIFFKNEFSAVNTTFRKRLSFRSCFFYHNVKLNQSVFENGLEFINSLISCIEYTGSHEQTLYALYENYRKKCHSITDKEELDKYFYECTCRIREYLKNFNHEFQSSNLFDRKLIEILKYLFELNRINRPKRYTADFRSVHIKRFFSFRKSIVLGSIDVSRSNVEGNFKVKGSTFFGRVFSSEVTIAKGFDARPTSEKNINDEAVILNTQINDILFLKNSHIQADVLLEGIDCKRSISLYSSIIEDSILLTKYHHDTDRQKSISSNIGQNKIGVSINIENAIIKGSIKIKSTKLDGCIDGQGSFVDGNFDIGDDENSITSFGVSRKCIVSNNSQIDLNRSIVLNNTQIKGVFTLNNVTCFGGIELDYARLEGLQIKNTKKTNTNHSNIGWYEEDFSYELPFPHRLKDCADNVIDSSNDTDLLNQRAKKNISISCRNAYIYGDLELYDVAVTGSIDLSGSTTHGNLSIDITQEKGNFNQNFKKYFLRQFALYKNKYLEVNNHQSEEISKHREFLTYLQKRLLKNASIDLSSSTVHGNLHIKPRVIGAINLTHCSVRLNILIGNYTEPTIYKNINKYFCLGISAGNAKLGGSLDLENIVVVGEVFLKGATIEGRMFQKESTDYVLDCLSLNHLTCKDIRINVNKRDYISLENIRTIFIFLKQFLDERSSSCETLLEKLSRVTPDDQEEAKKITSPLIVDLSFSSFDSFKLNLEQYSEELKDSKYISKLGEDIKIEFRVHGITFKSFSLIETSDAYKQNNNLEQNTILAFLELRDKEGFFDQDYIYTYLEKYHKEIGKDDIADAIFTKHKILDLSRSKGKQKFPGLMRALNIFFLPLTCITIILRVFLCYN
jgi:hypothetical protein